MPRFTLKLFRLWKRICSYKNDIDLFSKYNWLDKNINDIIDKIKDYLANMETVIIKW